MPKYIIFPGHSWLGLEMGRYQFFCKIDTISIFSLKISAINLVSVYSWHRRQVGLYNKRVPHGEFSSVRFYCAMHYSAKRGIEIACRLSVCLSVCLSVTLPSQEHIGWKSWQDSWAIAKKTARCAQYMGALKSFESPHYAPDYFSRNL